METSAISSREKERGLKSEAGGDISNFSHSPPPGHTISLGSVHLNLYVHQLYIRCKYFKSSEIPLQHRLDRYRLGIPTKIDMDTLDSKQPLQPHPSAFKWLALWSVDDVCQWLRKVNFSEFIPQFRKEQINGFD